MFCSACGRELAHVPPIQCGACGVEHWRNSKPCSGALVTRNNELLLVKRTIDPWNGLWDVPGGFCEATELPVATAEREILEETGYRIQVDELLGIWLDDYGEPSPALGQPEITMCLYYLAHPVDGGDASVDPDEVAEVRWFPADALPERMAFPNHVYEVLDAWKAKLPLSREGG